MIERLAEGGGKGLVEIIPVLVIVVIGIIVQIVNYFRKLAEEREARERRLRSGDAAVDADDEVPVRRPAAGGLEALLEALQQRALEQRTPQERPERERLDEDASAEAREPASHDELMEVIGEETPAAPAPDQHRQEERQARFEAAARRVEETERRARQAVAEIAAESTEAAASLIDAPPAAPPAELEEPEGQATPAVLMGMTAPAGGAPSAFSRDARGGILWTFILGQPRALAPYGESDSSSPPGDIV